MKSKEINLKVCDEYSFVITFPRRMKYYLEILGNESEFGKIY